MIEINSPQNAQFKLWKSLLESRGIKKEGLALISGRKIVPEIIEQRSISIRALISSDKSDEALLKQSPFYLLHKPLFQELDVLGTHSPLLLVEPPLLKDWQPELITQEFELLLGLSDPSNLGAVFRSALAFGVKNIVLLKESANPFLPKVFKTSAGAGLSLNLFKGPSIEDLNLKDGICLDLAGTDLTKFKWPKAGRLLLGEEGKGVPENLKLERINIPISKKVESLNAVVAASIALFDRQSKLTAKPK